MQTCHWQLYTNNCAAQVYNELFCESYCSITHQGVNDKKNEATEHSYSHIISQTEGQVHPGFYVDGYAYHF